MADNEHTDTKGVAGTASGGTAGALAGAAIGAAVAGPVGAMVGAGIGAVAGAAAGGALDYATHEPDFRKDHEADPAGPRHSFDEANPAYRYGWESFDRPEYHDKAYDHVRTELQKGWTGSGDFADYEPYVKKSWDRRSALGQSGSFSQAAKA